MYLFVGINHNVNCFSLMDPVFASFLLFSMFINREAYFQGCKESNSWYTSPKRTLNRVHISWLKNQQLLHTKLLDTVQNSWTFQGYHLDYLYGLPCTHFGQPLRGFNNLETVLKVSINKKYIQSNAWSYTDIHISEMLPRIILQFPFVVLLGKP